MPEISRFPGIVITTYFSDHDPPRFHVRYGEFRTGYAIDALKLLDGSLPSRVVGPVTERAALRRFELRRTRTLLATEGKFNCIEPLAWETRSDGRPGHRIRSAAGNQALAGFSDASAGEVDLRGFIEAERRPIVRQLGTPAACEAIKDDSDTVVRANGFDLAPQFLRARL